MTAVNNPSLRFRWSVCAAIVVLGCVLLTNLKINENALDLLPGQALKSDLRLMQRLGLVDKIFLTLTIPATEGSSRSERQQILKTAAEKLGTALARNPVFAEVLYKLPPGFELQAYGLFREHLPVLTDEADLATLSQAVRPEAVTSKLLEGYKLLNSPTGIALGKQIQQDPLGLSTILFGKMAALRSTFALDIVDGYFMSKDGTSCLLMAESRLPLTDSDNAEKIAAILAQNLLDAAHPVLKTLIIGSLPHTLANSRAIQKDLSILLPIASILLLLLLVFAFRDIRALAILVVPFAATPLAIGITNLFFDRISTMALGFGIVLLGISVDYGIHMYLELTRGTEPREIILQRIRRPILLAAGTTIAVFLVLLFSKVPAHRQMATLSLCGVILSLIISWLILPLFSPAKASPANKTVSLFRYDKSANTPRNILILAAWLILMLTGLFSWPRLHYNGNLQSLDIPSKQVIEEEHLFQKIWGQPQDQAFIISQGKTLAEALNLNSSVYQALQLTKTPFQSLAPLLPGPERQADNGERWHQFWQHNRTEFELLFSRIASSQGFSAKAFQPFFSWLDQRPLLLDPAAILTGPLQGLFTSMIRTPSRQYLGKDEQDDRQFLITTTVPMSEALLPAFTALEKSLPGVVLLANEKWRSQLETLMKHDILKLSLAAALANIVIIIIAFKSTRPVLAVLAPVLSALAAMAVYCYLTSSDLNMMHMLMGIMIVGLSVDYGVYAVCAIEEGISETSTLTVTLCAASTLIGFGVLAFASHPALSSLGVTALVGIGAAWPAALFVTPVLLGKFSGRQA